jgi:beta-glucosidase
LVSFTLVNTGVSDGDEIPQLYLSYPRQYGEPPKVLRSFRKVRVSAGASVLVDLSLSIRDLSVYDEAAHAWVPARGQFVVSVGASSCDIRGSVTFTM